MKGLFSATSAILTALPLVLMTSPVRADQSDERDDILSKLKVFISQHVKGREVEAARKFIKTPLPTYGAAAERFAEIERKLDAAEKWTGKDITDEIQIRHKILQDLRSAKANPQTAPYEIRTVEIELTELEIASKWTSKRARELSADHAVLKEVLGDYLDSAWRDIVSGDLAGSDSPCPGAIFDSRECPKSSIRFAGAPAAPEGGASEILTARNSTGQSYPGQ